MFQFLLIVVASVVVWFGAGLVIQVASSLAHTLRISPFLLSFFVLGILTSLPEIMIAGTSISRGEPELMVGNLIGGSLIIFLLIIPLLALVNGKINLPTRLSKTELIYALLVIILPAIFILDRQISLWEAVVLLFSYIILFIVLFRRQHILDRLAQLFHRHNHGHPALLIGKIIVGFILIFVGSQVIVQLAENLAVELQWNKFVVGLLIVSLGTNLPELSLIIRSVLNHKQNIALADYIGSAAANTMVMGVFTLLGRQPILLPNHSLQRIVLLVVGLVLFYFFSRSRHNLSRLEALVLLGFYFLLITIEVFSN